MKKLGKKGQGAMEYLMTYGWAIMVVMIVGVVLWQMGIFKMGSAGRGMSGFGSVKPLDHSSPANNQLQISFTNGAGARLSGIAVYASAGGSAVNSTITPDNNVAPGNTFTATWSAANSITGLCPAAAESYDANVNVSYNNAITGLSHSESGRIWGPC